MFFTKKKEAFFAPVKGELLPLEKVDDPVFSSKVMGDGFGIAPENNQVYSPVNGKVTSIFPTKHAILIETKKGQAVLVHIGIDTVELNGQGIDVHVKENQKVTSDTLLVTVDFPAILAQGKQTTVIVAFEGIPSIKLNSDGSVSAQEMIGTLD
ncbi:sugar permease [Enterococcus sp. JM4C]|uniref:PTS sugar transporter subunit IIA n=1 Tax=Candidatus Enterococcus huntleyi TaxID=1857217 RepID=UPI00137B533D|nr:PTS glucose transporter subunit IIA [Enterococcus sp. JM4C]KAF1299428.1 sugar permease [Enterococcus sp. JM4C]